MGAAMINPDIHITPEGGSQITIPVNPEKIQIGADAKFVTYNTISDGEIKIANGQTPEEVSWSGVFYGHARKGRLPMKTWETPNVLRMNFAKWRNRNTILTVEITGIKITGKFYVASFKGKYSGAYGDFYYDIKLVKADEILIYTTSELTPKSSKTGSGKKRPQSKKTSKTKAKSSKSKTTSYTVKSGDTLYGIATKKLGKGSRWKEIYSKNKTVIEKTAKKYGKKSSSNGHWIYPGTKLTIPAK